MDEEVSTKFWVEFFCEAGIPPVASANYAIIFSENRIQKHMLLDLNKEYLKDMGVNVLGDIIAILKHSKRHHEKVAREKVLSTDKETSVLKATKHLNEILLKEDPVKAVTSSPKRTETVVPAIQQTIRPSPPKKVKLNQPELKKPVIIADDSDDHHEEVELKRKVIAPSKGPAKFNPATTAKLAPTKKTSVFDRLGESNVTSTTPEVPDSSNKSVFNRLGELPDKEAVQSSPVAKQMPITTPARLASSTYNSVKKLTTVSNQAKPVSASAGKGYLRMDTETAEVKSSARDRLGLNKTAKSTVKTLSNQVGRKNRVLESRPSTETTSSGVKQRLGVNAKVANNKQSTGSTTSVFSRLSLKK